MESDDDFFEESSEYYDEKYAPSMWSQLRSDFNLPKEYEREAEYGLADVGSLVEGYDDEGDYHEETRSRDVESLDEFTEESGEYYYQYEEPASGKTVRWKEDGATVEKAIAPSEEVEVGAGIPFSDEVCCSEDEMYDDEEEVEVSVYDMINEAISEGNENDLKAALYEIEMGTPEKAASSIFEVLTLCFEHQRQDMVRLTVDHWRSFNFLEAERPVLVSLYFLPEVDIDVLKFVRDSLRDKNTDRYFEAVRYRLNSPSAVDALQRLGDVYGRADAETYRSILKNIEEYQTVIGSDNTPLREHVTERISEVERYAAYPSWISSERRTVPAHSDLAEEAEKYALLRMETAVSNLTSQERRYAINSILEAPLEIFRDNAVVDSIRRKLESSDEKDARDINNLLRSNNELTLYSDRQLFRTFGPAHPISGYQTTLDSRSKVPCDKFGGCRMMLCYEFENIDPLTGEPYDVDIVENENYDLVDWFRNSCDYCLKKIRAKHHALRRPMISGGWVGCFCSWNCIIESYSDKDYPLWIELVNVIRKQFEEFGIEDRIWTVRTGKSERGTLDMARLLDSIDRFNMKDGVFAEDPGHRNMNARHPLLEISEDVELAAITSSYLNIEVEKLPSEDTYPSDAKQTTLEEQDDEDIDIVTLPEAIDLELDIPEEVRHV